MSRRAVPDVVYSTMGHSNPSPLTRSRVYQYRGRAGWPDDPATRDGGGEIQAPQGGAIARSAERKRKLAVFTLARAEGLDVIEAGKRAGVARKTAYRYEKDRLAAQAGTPS